MPKFNDLQTGDVYLELTRTGTLYRCEEENGATPLKKTGPNECETLDGKVHISGQDPDRRVVKIRM